MDPGAHAPEHGSFLLGRAVPPTGPGVCRVCHGPARDGWARCWACRVQDSSPHVPSPPVVPVALYAVGDPLHRVLRRYKDGTVPQARRHFAARLVEHLAAFFVHHTRCLTAAYGPWSAVAVVPSSAARRVQGRHPFEAVVASVPMLRDVPRLHLVPGSGSAAHLSPDPAAFAVVDPPVRGSAVLLLDDTWTTGARLRSAAAALVQAGARVGVAVVAGRAVDLRAMPAPAARRADRLGSGVTPATLSAPTRCCLPACQVVGAAQGVAGAGWDRAVSGSRCRSAVPTGRLRRAG